MNKKGRRNLKLKKEKIVEDFESDSDENFAIIAGYTSGGVPFGLTHDEMAEISKKMQIEYIEFQTPLLD